MTAEGTLEGKHILLGVTGSIAAYKAVDIMRRLQELGADIRVAMTANATRFISPLTFETLSGKPVLSNESRNDVWTGIGHIDITTGLDLAIIAPATANIIGKVATGIADDALTTAFLAADCPIIIAPAMNDRMYRNPAVQKNILVLKERGFRFVEPGCGPLACGTIGQGRLADTGQITQEITSLLSNGSLAGVNVLVTAGPTREQIDAVRFISNPSTGKMGYALASAARERGAVVTLISGPTDLSAPQGVSVISVKSAADMYRAVLARANDARIVIMAAAVSDFRPVVSSDRKIKKQEAPMTVALERTEDILLALGKVPGKRLLVGFAAETDNLIENATQKLKSKNLDLIIANDLLKKGAGFGTDTNSITIIDRRGVQAELPVLPKTDVARRIMDKIAELSAN